MSCAGVPSPRRSQQTEADKLDGDQAPTNRKPYLIWDTHQRALALAAASYGVIVGLANPNRGLKAEANASRSSEIVVVKIAAREPAIHLREHGANVGVPFRQELPIDDAGNHLLGPGACRRGTGGAADSIGRLRIMIPGADQIDVFDNRISHAGPNDVQDLVAGIVGGVVDGGVIAAGFACTNAGYVDELGLRIARRRKLDPFEARIESQPIPSPFGHRHHALIVR
jgi:hypothetical protein